MSLFKLRDHGTLCATIPILAVTLSIVGCSAAPPPAPPAGSVSYGGKLYLPLQTVPPPASQGSAGVLTSSVEADGGVLGSPSIIVVSDGGAVPKIADMAESDIEKAIRPIMVQSGDPTMYQAADATELAHAIKTGQVWSGGQSASAKPQSASDLKLQYVFQENNPGNPLPANQDNRFSEYNWWPNTTEVWIQSTVPGGGFCSGTYVGAHTLLTAAHCLYTVNGVSAWTSLIFTAYAQGTSAPFGVYGPPGAGICYNAAFPAGWVNNTNDETFDFGLIDFRRCGNPQIAQTGWMGITENGPAGFVEVDGYPGWFTIGSNGMSTGYPTQVPGSSPPCPLATTYPWLCGTAYSGSYWNSYYIETGYVTQTQGQSGGPYWNWINNSPQVLGVAVVERWYYDFGRCGFNPCYRNAAHGVDTAYWNFIVANSEIGH